MAGVRRFLRQVVEEALADNITGEAAKVAYYFFLSLFPLVLVLFALTGIFGGDDAFRWIMDRVHLAMPGEASSLVEAAVAEITQEARPGILSIGVVLTLWAASNVYAAFSDGLNVIYGVKEGRSWWRKRVIALLLLLGTAVLLITGAVLLLAGAEIGTFLALGAAWEAMRGPLAFVLMTGVLWLLYFVLPSRDQRQAKGPILAGAVAGTLLWIGATLLFRLYVANFGNYSDTYGFVGAAIVLLLWLYISTLAVLLGGEVAWVSEQWRDRGRSRTTHREDRLVA